MLSQHSSHPNIRVSQQCTSDAKNIWDKLGVIAERPKFPQYASIERRLETFKKWPSHLTQRPSDLAAAGFAFTGVSDAVRCYHCGNGLRNWESNDCPWKQHAFHFRLCAHVRQCKGEDYIRQVHGEVSLDTEDCSSASKIDDVTSLSELRESNCVAVQAAKEFDMLENQIDEALKHFLSRGVEIFSAVDLIKTIEQIESGDISSKTNSSKTNSSKTNSKSDNDDSKHYSDMKEENDSLKEQFACKICFDARACIITIPCGHMVTCPQCIGPLKTCCICRSPIEGTVRAFLSAAE